MKTWKLLGLAAVMGVASFGFGNTVEAANTTEAKEFNGHYYQVVTTSTNYGAAEIQCELKGAHLATITSQEEQDFIYSLTGTDDVWLGAEYKNGAWTWVTGEPFTYTNWKQNQPSNPAKENYLHFWDGKGEWDDVSDKAQGYVMEWDSIQAYQSKNPVILNKVKYNGHSYKFIQGAYTWKEAKDLCKKLGGYLVTITSEGENNFAYSLTNKKNTWIGLNDAKKNGKYVWVTGERTDYLKFGSEVNDGFGGQEKYFGFYSYTGKKWNDYRNNEPGMSLICEWDDENPVVLTKVKSTIKVQKGKKVSLKYQVYPAKTKVTFKSSSKKVATVNKKGVVTGKKKGTAKITIKAKSKKTVVKVKVK